MELNATTGIQRSSRVPKQAPELATMVSMILAPMSRLTTVHLAISVVRIFLAMLASIMAMVPCLVFLLSVG